MTNSTALYLIVFAALLLTGCPVKTVTNGNGSETKTDTTAVQTMLANFGRERAKQIARLEDPKVSDSEKLAIVRQIDAEDTAIALAAESFARGLVRAMEHSAYEWTVKPGADGFQVTQKLKPQNVERPGMVFPAPATTRP